MKSSGWPAIELVLRKEITVGMRFKAAWAAMLMFAFTTLSCVSIALQGMAVPPQLQAALLWIALFFAAMSGSDRVFTDEATAGTLQALRVYGPSQPILFGKMLYMLLVLLVMAVFLVPLFIVLMDAPVTEPFLLLATVLAGCWGIAGAGTLISALMTGASVSNGLFSILMFPIILPVFLPAIMLTAGAFGYGEATMVYLGGMVLYDAVLTTGASLLFDYLWYEA